jgi:hypothetical protein
MREVPVEREDAAMAVNLRQSHEAGIGQRYRCVSIALHQDACLSPPSSKAGRRMPRLTARRIRVVGVSARQKEARW